MNSVSAQTLPDIEIDGFRARLQELRAEQVRDLESAHETLMTLTASQAFGDAALQQVVAHAQYMADVTPDIIAEIDAALLRIESGTYGLCEQCGNLILLSRLLFRPYGRLCTDCIK